MATWKILFAMIVLGTLGNLSCVAERPADRPVDTHMESVAQPLVDESGWNWLVAGSAGGVEVAGGQDGEPDVVTGRFVLEGGAIHAAASGDDRWIVAGAGIVQAFDERAERIRESRPVLQGETAHFVEKGDVGWLVGGSSGRLQMLDAQGEPTQSEGTILEGAELRSASFNGFSWLVGSADGRIELVAGDLQGSSLSGQVVSSLPVFTVAADGTNFLAFSGDSYSHVSPQGTVLQTEVLESGVDVTAVMGNSSTGLVALGTGDGRFGVFEAATLSPLQNTGWFSVLAGNAVRAIYADSTSPTSYLLVGDGGYAQIVDVGAGAMNGSPVRIVEDSLMAAHPIAAGWLLVVGEVGMVRMVAQDLSDLRALETVMDTGDIYAGAMGKDAALVVGAGGKYQLLTVSGEALEPPQTVSGAADLHAVSFAGDRFLIAGAGGQAMILDKDGVPMGDVMDLLDGNTIHFAAWSGEFWLVGGDGGYVQRIRLDGTPAEAPKQIAGASIFMDGGWSGAEWLVGGGTSDSKAFYCLVETSGELRGEPVVVERMSGRVNALDFNGREWLLGGTAGTVQRVAAEGSLLFEPIDILGGRSIEDISFSGANYAVVGESGAFRRLSHDLLPLRVPLALIDGGDARVLLWTRNRGFSDGVCLTDEVCYVAPCVGGLEAGRCCDSACDRPCESCFERDTNQPDGTCAAVVEGKQPPVRDDNMTIVPCEVQGATTCGRTGVCDGMGRCQYYGSDTECAAPICSVGKYTAPSYCDGTGQCSGTEEVSCAPYNECSPEGCDESCGEDRDCIAGHACVEGACVEREEEMEETPVVQPKVDDSGCSSIGRKSPPSRWAQLIVLGFLFTLPFKRRRSVLAGRRL